MTRTSCGSISEICTDRSPATRTAESIPTPPEWPKATPPAPPARASPPNAIPNLWHPLGHWAIPCGAQPPHRPTKCRAAVQNEPPATLPHHRRADIRGLPLADRPETPVSVSQGHESSQSAVRPPSSQMPPRKPRKARPPAWHEPPKVAMLRSPHWGANVRIMFLFRCFSCPQ